MPDLTNSRQQSCNHVMMVPVTWICVRCAIDSIIAAIDSIATAIAAMAQTKDLIKCIIKQY